jgi:hypothetical protein
MQKYILTLKFHLVDSKKHWVYIFFLLALQPIVGLYFAAL